ncbi:MAG TPA: hypothetical protein VN969_25070 [Streptosporangiaceae bacterium]|jgi:hypothetical protein|nr:hypothetical protein [Streptosporangiaceae bacterium]
MSECRCLIRHAITAGQHQQAREALDAARAAGDGLGIMLAVARLTGYCPARWQEREGCSSY